MTRASQILGLFRPDRPTLTVADAAAALGLNRTTTHRYFASLVSAGLLERSRDGSAFVPGGLLVQLGAFSLGRRAVVELAPPHLVSLARTTGLSSALSLWGASGPVVARVEEDNTNPVVVSVRVGHQLPVDSAQCQVFLAFMADQLRADRLVASVAGAGRRALVEGVERARETGLASTHIVDSDITAVGAPVFDESGICATIAVIGTARTLPVETPGAAWRDLAGTAYELSKELGGEHHFPQDFTDLL
ncbi:helix-turn-helix domain-containing protein [Pseudonocardia kujensis]|uniref:IclR family transcriptional regulator n=1 Tax=Pseudonocardia kujensis TaxID=1128675 RepID=UPI001E5A37AF|nr:helix-turn-helix domain-containing protein [Pseudonocardia kujensis]MCE0762353.1 helix-turn-helix domain-containing protein [Pseudonocardia kujensis]